ncbi:Hsp20/alpha crystallin family protein [Leptolyngbya sp. FACHB-36]|uniref:Hsp20/alpha crystallin family protein n=1 Tax=Leptolyngbya sp. FACHB-36 TaxID=2692808 RepID=UPI00168039A6|nr:Hsp20/alpha crystallin family protein [Leptolyngbya sp. FACHB-36]MBD2019845.1 Hsp20/alpha crystallin family protein [Leptolyngbya sp. FACHB-36]
MLTRYRIAPRYIQRPIASPWQEMAALTRQLDHVFADLTPATETRKPWAPAIELKQTDSEVVLRAELPGIDAKDLEVNVTREAVSISGEYRSENKTEDQHVFRSEFRYGSFRRVVPLPVEVQNTEVTAEFKDGVLTLTLPKADDRAVKVNLPGTTDAPAVESTETATADATTETTEDVWAQG